MSLQSLVCALTVPLFKRFGCPVPPEGCLPRGRPLNGFISLTCAASGAVYIEITGYPETALLCDPDGDGYWVYDAQSDLCPFGHTHIHKSRVIGACEQYLMKTHLLHYRRWLREVYSQGHYGLGY